MGVASPGLALIFEDDPALRFVIDELLVGLGLRVKASPSLPELMRSAQDEKAAVVVTDFWGTAQMHLSDLDRRFLSRLGELAPTIVVSGRAWTRDETAQSLGVVQLVPKPFEINQLEKSVQTCLRRGS